jgi:hypothetical protein
LPLIAIVGRYYLAVQYSLSKIHIFSLLILFLSPYFRKSQQRARFLFLGMKRFVD